jgi:hypothetical protein
MRSLSRLFDTSLNHRAQLSTDRQKIIFSFFYLSLLLPLFARLPAAR